jgi:hypothetical protein
MYVYSEGTTMLLASPTCIAHLHRALASLTYTTFYPCVLIMSLLCRPLRFLARKGPSAPPKS